MGLTQKAILKDKESALVEGQRACRHTARSCAEGDLPRAYRFPVGSGVVGNDTGPTQSTLRRDG